MNAQLSQSSQPIHQAADTGPTCGYAVDSAGPVCTRVPSEADGRCVLHSLDVNKDPEAFWRLINTQCSAKNYDFSGYAFPAGADFGQMEFIGAADFRDVTFMGAASFYRATLRFARFERARLKGTADFRAVNFSGADFEGAHFGDVAQFEEATFSGPVRFDAVTFDKDATFRAARFAEGVMFVGTVFSGRAEFSDVTFVSSATFDKSKFARGASFRDASVAKDAALTYAAFAGPADFTRAIFRGTVNLGMSEFLGLASFTECDFWAPLLLVTTRFVGAAYFGAARFRSSADFHVAQFLESADFQGTWFLSDATFGRTTFTGEASFQDAKFQRECNFVFAKFPQPVTFMGAEFLGGAHFNQAEFSAWTAFIGTRFVSQADFIKAEFRRGADFSQARFASTANFWQTRFSDQTEFFQTEFADRCAFTTDLQNVTFRATNLSQCRFAGAYKLEKAEFEHVEWARWPTEPSHRLSGRSRIATADELDARVATSDEWEDTERYLRAAEQVYRGLRASYESRKDHPRVGAFYFAEMEMRRLAHSPRWLARTFGSLTAWYGLVSGYGERWIRALGFFAGVCLFWALLYVYVGLWVKVPAINENGVGETHLVLLTELASRSDTSMYGGLEQYGHALLHSFLVATFVGRDMYAQPVSTNGYVVQTIELIAGPLVAGLLGLAIRRQFQR